jgi:protein phosphatase
LRGSHEDYDLCKFFGLGEECSVKLGEDITKPDSVFAAICDLFNYFPLAATVNDKILCVHSGIGESTKTLEDIANVKKPYRITENQVALDVLWNSPLGTGDYTGDNTTSIFRKRYFDEALVNEFMKNNKITLIIRSHDVIDSGFEKLYDNKVISIFSATNYCGVYNNSGGILFIKKNSEIQPKILTCEDNYAIWTFSSIKNFPASPKRSFKK